ncbi:hypothetical protein [Streptomyces sp. NPDC056628]
MTVVRSWLEGAATTAGGIDGDEDTSRRLDGAAELLGLRHVDRFRPAGK